MGRYHRVASTCCIELHGSDQQASRSPFKKHYPCVLVHPKDPGEAVGGIQVPLVGEVVLALHKPAEAVQQVRVEIVRTTDTCPDSGRDWRHYQYPHCQPQDPEGLHALADKPLGQDGGGAGQISRVGRNYRDKQGPLHHPGIDILIMIDSTSNSSGIIVLPKGLNSGAAVSAIDSALPAGRNRGREGLGNAVIGGLAPPVVGVL